MSKLIDKLSKRLEAENIEVQKLSDKQTFSADSTYCPTGMYELEYNLGVLGFPVGLTELAGASRSGKTTVSYSALANFQKKYKDDAFCIVLSSERRDNKPYAEKMGVDVENVIIIKSHYVEDLMYTLQIYLNEIDELWIEEKRKGKPRIMIVWDSVGATLSRAEVDSMMENVDILKKSMKSGKKAAFKHAQMGAFAKNAKQLVKGIIGQLYDRNIIMLAINHTNVDFQTNVRKSGGGNWIEYLPTLRLQLSLFKTIKLKEKGSEEETEVAQLTKVKVIKNDFGSRRTTYIEILLGAGIVLSENDIAYAIEHKILKQESKLKVSFGDGKKLKWASKREFYQNYLDDNSMLKVLHKKVEQLRHEDIMEEIDEDDED